MIKKIGLFFLLPFFVLVTYLSFSEYTGLNVFVVIGLLSPVGLILFFANKKLVSLYGSFTFKEINSNTSIRDYYKYTLPILVTTIFIGFALSADKIVLSEIINAEQIGLYFSAFTLSNILGYDVNKLYLYNLIYEYNFFRIL